MFDQEGTDRATSLPVAKEAPRPGCTDAALCLLNGWRHLGDADASSGSSSVRHRALKRGLFREREVRRSAMGSVFAALAAILILPSAGRLRFQVVCVFANTEAPAKLIAGEAQCEQEEVFRDRPGLCRRNGAL